MVAKYTLFADNSAVGEPPMRRYNDGRLVGWQSWLNAPVLKIGVRLRTVGSNPTPTACIHPMGTQGIDAGDSDRNDAIGYLNIGMNQPYRRGGREAEGTGLLNRRVG